METLAQDRAPILDAPEAPASRTLIMVSSGLFALIASLMAIRELPDLYNVGEAPYYLLGRVVVIGVALFHVLLAYGHRKVWNYPAQIYAIGILYAVHGQYFQPNYWMAFIELNALSVALFPIRKHQLPWLFAAALGAFLMVFFSRADFYVAQGALTKPMVGDIVVAVIVTQLVSLALYQILVSLREEATRINQRFTDLGRNFSFVLHDIKGMISSQVVYASVLRNAASSESLPRKERESLGYLVEDIEALQGFVGQINRLIRSELSEEVASTRVSQSFELVNVLFRSKLKKVELRLEGDLALQIRPYLLNRVLINAITNSLEELGRNRVESGRIVVSCLEGAVIVRDNSGARLDAQLLKSLNRPFLSLSRKAGGSGMGTYIIKQCVHSLGGTVHFSNGEEGVLVRIQFPKDVILSDAS